MDDAHDVRDTDADFDTLGVALDDLDNDTQADAESEPRADFEPLTEALGDREAEVEADDLVLADEHVLGDVVAERQAVTDTVTVTDDERDCDREPLLLRLARAEDEDEREAIDDCEGAALPDARGERDDDVENDGDGVTVIEALPRTLEALVVALVVVLCEGDGELLGTTLTVGVSEREDTSDTDAALERLGPDDMDAENEGALDGERVPHGDGDTDELLRWLTEDAFDKDGLADTLEHIEAVREMLGLLEVERLGSGERDCVGLRVGDSEAVGDKLARALALGEALMEAVRVVHRDGDAVVVNDSEVLLVVVVVCAVEGVGVRLSDVVAEAATDCDSRADGVTAPLLAAAVAHAEGEGVTEEHADCDAAVEALSVRLDMGVVLLLCESVTESTSVAKVDGD